MAKSVRLPLTQQLYGTEYKTVEPLLTSIAEKYKQSSSAAKAFLDALLLDQSSGNTPEERKSVQTAYLSATEEGSPDAFCNLGVFYETSSPANRKKAIECYKKAIGLTEALLGQGHPVAMCNLGAMLADGSGIETDEATAFELFTDAATLGNPTAYLNLGICYHYAKGCVKDTALASSNYKKAMEKGVAEAYFRMGTLCLENCDAPNQTEFSVDKAIAHFKKAAQMGISDAYFELACIYSELRKDDALMIENCQKAVDKGNSNAAFMLAQCYLDGTGVTKNRQKAISLLKKAAAGGNRGAKRKLDALQN